MADHGCFGGVLSLYKDSVTCFCEVSLCSRESKKTIRLTDPTRSLPCPLLPSAALYCSLLPFTVLYLPFTALHCLFLPFTCPLRPFTALYCPSLPFTALYCMGQWLIKRSGRYRLGYRLPSHVSHAKFRHKCRGCANMSPQMIFVDRIAFGGVLSLSKEIGKIRHSTVTLLLTTITEVLTDAQMKLRQAVLPRPRQQHRQCFRDVSECTTSADVNVSS